MQILYILGGVAALRGGSNLGGARPCQAGGCNKAGERSGDPGR